jgi:hypothetical protein
VFEHLEPIYRLIDGAIAALSRAQFPCDPILDARRSLETSIASSAIKRHGMIMEAALRQSLAASPHYDVWKEPAFAVSQAADALINAQSEDAALGSALPYEIAGPNGRRISIDLLTYDRRRTLLGAYEFKRGHGYHDAGKIRQIKRDLRAASVLLRSYGMQRGLEIGTTAATVIFYYGKQSIAAPWGMPGSALDVHFAWPVCCDIDEATRYFTAKLNALFEDVA